MFSDSIFDKSETSLAYDSSIGCVEYFVTLTLKLFLSFSSIFSVSYFTTFVSLFEPSFERISEDVVVMVLVICLTLIFLVSTISLR